MNESTVAGAGRDQILDFSHAQADRVDLHLIDADANVGGNQAFTFIGTDPFSHHAGELHYAFTGTYTTVSGDVDGNGTADFSIVVSGHVALTAGATSCSDHAGMRVAPFESPASLASPWSPPCHSQIAIATMPGAVLAVRCPAEG